ncbi:hypothetical protein SteCoe_2318 [Stentor coeruleus]|uniref:MalT-like TPR region domain-containing protein n=1 Tax=Stentor coeruleus TaxID=5963 RepID=A0A1R2CZV8_9CILI|nr:hypothetical protein SteCoe_2318 [Stentor coeruleus]
MGENLADKVLRLNCQAMNSLETPKRALKFLQEAERLLLDEHTTDEKNKNSLSLLSVTFNNLACYYKSVKQPNVSLFYLIQALKVETESFADPSDIASTNLNICAIYSQLGKHQQAVESALSALKYLQSYENEESLSEDAINSLVVAYFNLGVEYEHLRKFQQSKDSYLKGRNFAEEYFGPTNVMTVKLNESFKNVNDHTESLNSFINSRRELKNHPKYNSKIISPITTHQIPELNPYKIKIGDIKLPSIHNKVKKKHVTNKTSLDPTERNIENRGLIIENGINRTRKFWNAVDRLKALMS